MRSIKGTDGISARWERRFLSSFASILVALLPALARAEPSAADAALAETLFRDGKELMAAKQFDAACPKLQESNRLDPGSGTLLALALCHEGEATGSSAASLTSAAPEIVFTSSWTETATPLVAGQQAQISYDIARLPTCRGELGYGGSEPSWSIDGAFTVNGINLNESIGVGGLGLLNLYLPSGALPTLSLPFAGNLAMWFVGTDAFGCRAWDSNYGANYGFVIAPPANAPGWVGNASVLIDRATCGVTPGPCYADAAPADGGATYDTWARERAFITQIFFDVWKSGVTDFANPDLWQQLDVESHHRVDPTATFATDYVNFAERTGNNARYAVDLRALDPLGGAPGGTALTSASQCPAIPAAISADGQYVQVDMEIFFTVNGVAVQPSAGGTFHVLFQNYVGLYAICAFPRGQ